MLCLFDPSVIVEVNEDVDKESRRALSLENERSVLNLLKIKFCIVESLDVVWAQRNLWKAESYTLDVLGCSLSIFSQDHEHAPAVLEQNFARLFIGIGSIRVSYPGVCVSI